MDRGRNQRCALAGGGDALSGAPPPRAQRLGAVGVGRLREQPQSKVLSHHRRRPCAVPFAGANVASLRRRHRRGASCLTRDGARVTEPGRPPGWRPLFRLPFARKRAEQDVDEEIAFHLAMRAERLRSRGLTADDARAAAEQRFGDVAHVRGEMLAIDRNYERHKNFIEYQEDVVKDLVIAFRALRRAPAFAAAAILTLALGIGSPTAIFSVAYGVLLRPLPYPDADRLMEISVDIAGVNAKYGTLSAPEYVDLARTTRSF